MTSLEFIGKEINHLKIVLSCMVNKDAKKDMTNNLKHLQQIKYELEAWEVCKEFIVNLGGEYNMCIDNYYNTDEYQILEKALEINYESKE